MHGSIYVYIHIYIFHLSIRMVNHLCLMTFIYDNSTPSKNRNKKLEQKKITENLSSEEMTNYLRAFVTFAVKYFD